MGKLVGEIMIDFAFIRKYPIVNYNGKRLRIYTIVIFSFVRTFAP